jgi:glycosyltransferase involved in cell wall biosynthesis
VGSRTPFPHRSLLSANIGKIPEQHLRVLHAYKVFPPDVMGGIPEVIAYLSERMAPRHQSSVLVARSRGWGRRYSRNGVPVEALSSLATVLSAPICPSFPFVLARRSRTADLVAFHHPFPLNDIGAAIGFPSKTALVVHWHSEIFGREPFSNLIAPFVRRTLSYAQHIIVSNPLMASESPFLTGHSEKCTVIPYGIDVPYWMELNALQRQKVYELRSRHPRLVITTGRLVPYKGFHVLIEALRSADATAIIVGEGPLHKDLLRLATQLGVSHRLITAGMISRDDLKILLHAARIYVQPSITSAEAFGIAQIEAMSVGLPIVNTSLHSGFPQVARHELEGLTVPPNDPAALASAITELLADPERSKRLGSAGRIRARAEFRVESFLERTEEVYRNAVYAADASST